MEQSGFISPLSTTTSWWTAGQTQLWTPSTNYTTFYGAADGQWPPQYAHNDSQSRHRSWHSSTLIGQVTHQTTTFGQPAAWRFLDSYAQVNSHAVLGHPMMALHYHSRTSALTVKQTPQWSTYLSDEARRHVWDRGDNLPWKNGQHPMSRISTAGLPCAPSPNPWTSFSPPVWTTPLTGSTWAVRQALPSHGLEVSHFNGQFPDRCSNSGSTGRPTGLHNPTTRALEIIRVPAVPETTCPVYRGTVQSSVRPDTIAPTLRIQLQSSQIIPTTSDLSLHQLVIV